MASDKLNYESRLHRAVRKMVERKMHVQSFVTYEGQMICNVNGYNLTAKQILELDSKNGLTSWGIREYAKR